MFVFLSYVVVKFWEPSLINFARRLMVAFYVFFYVYENFNVLTYCTMYTNEKIDDCMKRKVNTLWFYDSFSLLSRGSSETENVDEVL